MKKKKINKQKNKKVIIKEIINKLFPGIILAFVTSFMFFIYEPLLMYATNIDDFWFDFKLLFTSNILIFFVVFVLLIIAYIILYLIDKKYFKNNKLLNIFTIISYGTFLIFYIQGNYLIGGLPALDGSKIIWSKYIVQHIISIILIIIVSISMYLLVKKYKYEKIINICKYFSLAIFGMLFISLITTLLTTKDVFAEKKAIYSTTKNFEKYSSEENFIIFLVDAVDSVMFKEVLEESEDYSETFNDFTYFPDTLSAYPFTRDSIPFIFSGLWNENKTSFYKYSNKAFNNSVLLDTLKKQNYDLNIYGHEIIWTEEKVNNSSNIEFIKNEGNIMKLFKQELKYTLFKYLPFPIKKYSKIEDMNFEFCKVNKQHDIYYYWDAFIYNLIKNTKYKVVEKNQFKFIHIEGGHVPFNYDKDVNIIDDGTYEQKLEATITIISTYLNKLKDLNVYDNSNIIVMADHGYSFEGTVGRQNPILFIKGINEEHEMYESDLPISYEDLNDIYLDLLDSKTSDKLLENIDLVRERRYMFYKYTLEDNMIEYVQKGKAWDEDTLEKTGREFNR